MFAKKVLLLYNNNDTMRRVSATLYLTLALLTACRGAKEPSEQMVRSSQSGLRVSARIAGSEGKTSSVPASIAGVQVGTILGGGTAPATFPPATNPEIPQAAVGPIQDTNLLQKLIELLSTEVRSMLNRARDRAQALQDYTRSLASYTRTGQVRLRVLQDREEELRDDQRRLQRTVQDLRGDLDDAIRAGDGRGAATLINELVSRQTALAQAETDLVVTSRLVEALSDVLTPLDQRQQAIEANRDALIKGVQVVDIPGVETLGVIEVRDGIRRIRTGRRTGIGIFGGF